MRRLTFVLPLLLGVAITVYARCATVEVLATIPTISAGAVEPISVKVTNCDSRPALLRTEVTITSACGEVKTYEVAAHEKAGRATFITIGHQVLEGACPGTYEVSAVVRVGQTVLNSANTSFTVQ